MIGALSAEPIYAQQKDFFSQPNIENKVESQKSLKKQVVKDNNITNDRAEAKVAVYKKQGGKLSRTDNIYEFSQDKWHCKKTIIIDDYVAYLKQKGQEAEEWMQDFLAGNKNEEIKEAIVNSLRETKEDYAAAWQFYKKLLFNSNEAQEDVIVQEVKPNKKELFKEKW